MAKLAKYKAITINIINYLTFHLLLKTPSKFIAFNFTGTFKYHIYIKSVNGNTKT